jgi:hypothetical protein
VNGETAGDGRFAGGYPAGESDQLHLSMLGERSSA